MLPRIRLKYILFITFTLIASLPVLILAGWVEESALNKEISSVKEKHLLVARNLTRGLERYVGDVESSFNLVSKNMVMGIKIGGISAYLDSLFLRYIRIINPDGVIIKQVVATKTRKVNQVNSQTLKTLSPIMKKARANIGNVMFSDLVRTGKDKTTFYLVKALTDGHYIVGALSTSYILKVQKKISFGRRGHVAIVDRTGRAIAHPIPSWVKTMKDMSFLPPVKQMMQGKTGVSKFYTPAMKADMVAGFTVVSRTGWGVMIPQPFEELQERANDVREIALTIALIGVAISALISWYIANLLCNPIQSVVDATELGTDEDDSHPISSVMTTQRFIPYELRVLLESFNHMRTNLNALTAKLHSKIDLANAAVKDQNILLEHQSKILMENNKILERLTCTDPLTELFNRRHFDNALGTEISYALRHREAFGLLMIDLDYFKDINDTYGHSAGDKVLQQVATVIVKSVRQSDIVCRVGGEEFAVIFLNVTDNEMRIVAESLRSKIEQTEIMFQGKKLAVTASIGVSIFRGSSEESYSQDQLYKDADTAMYYSKNHGRNRVTHYDDIAKTV